MTEWRARVGPAWGHSAEAVTGWLEAAGAVVLGPGVQDVRVRAGTEWREAAYRLRSPGRMVKAVARVR